MEPGRIGPTGPPSGENPGAEARSSGPEPSSVRPADASARTTRRTQSSGPPEDQTRSHLSERSAEHSVFG
jgi:hypothetical protein